MRIFVSYASEDRPVATEIAMALINSGHDVFYDETTLPPGGDYNARIRDAIAECQLVIFLMSVSSLKAGKYTLTELELAKSKWPRPVGAILPVAIGPVDLKSADKYLTSVTVYTPKGSVAAEVAHRVSQLQQASSSNVHEQIVRRDAEEVRKLLRTDVRRSIQRFLDFTKQYCSDACVREAVSLAARLQSLTLGPEHEGPPSEEERQWITDYLACVEHCEKLAMVPKQYHSLLEVQAKATMALTADEVVGEWQRKSEMGQTAVVRAEGVGKRFRSSGFDLENVSIEVYPGQILAVVGMNASGKTTLLRMLVGELRPDRGRVVFPALDAARPDDELRSQIGFVSQSLPPWQGRLVDNLHMAATAAGIKGEENELFVDFLLLRYDLKRFAHLGWSSISGGYKLRFALARALISRPKLLVLDEPLANLDYVAQQRVLADMRYVARSMDNPIPIIVTSQHVYEIEQVASHVIMLDNGKVTVAADLAELRANYEEYVYEVHFAGDDTRFLEQLRANLPEIKLDAVFGGFIFTIARDSNLRDNFLRLCGQFADDLRLFRDLSGSTRKLFRENIVGYSNDTGFRRYAARR